MYTNEEASAIRQQFWTCFGQYMAPVPSLSYEKVNWINYKTGIKGISFKMDADKNSATAAIEIRLPNKELQHQYFSIFTKFAKQFKQIVGTQWVHDIDFVNEYDQHASKIFITLNGVNIFNKNDWPTIITFLKRNIISLNNFWNEYKPAFENM